jgi:hypothetical protein
VKPEIHPGADRDGLENAAEIAGLVEVGKILADQLDLGKAERSLGPRRRREDDPAGVGDESQVAAMREALREIEHDGAILSKWVQIGNSDF